MFKEMGSVLVHCCCAHCAAYTVGYWRGQGYEVAGFWYNPNIQPESEYLSRLDSMKSLAEQTGLCLHIEEYEPEKYFRAVRGNEADRCRYCFTLRLGRTARKAREEGIGSFTTTLLISPQQKHGLIRETGEREGKAEGVQFLYADLRKRYSDSRHITKPLNLYRQQWCGCVYSRRERLEEEARRNPDKP